MEFIPEHLYFILTSSLPEFSRERNNDDVVIDLDDLYQHTKVRKHFGPPSLKIIWKHCAEVDARLKRNNRVIFLTNNLNDNLHIEQRTLSSFLMATYGVLRLQWDADKVNEVLLTGIPARLAFFRDYHGDSSYKLNILDCLRGLQIGCKGNAWFTSFAHTKFPYATNAHLDMNWIIPGQLLAFKDPTIHREKENRSVSNAFIKELRRCGIKVVVRLNGNDHTTNIEYYGKSYPANDFKKEQFFHYEIPFRDVGTPSTVQAHQFVALCERYGGKIAVHCHAGLGRTATMIGCYLIKHYGFDSRSACGWLKLCRRGSVMGPQHFFLDKYQVDLENIKNSLTEPLKPMQEKLSREQVIVTTAVKPISKTRSPRKNNIVHIAPVNVRQRNNGNPMQKYKFESVDVESVDNIRSKVATAIAQRQQQRRRSSTRSQQKLDTVEKNISTSKPTLAKPRPPSSSTAVIKSKPSTKDSSPKPKRMRKQSSPRLCYSKMPARPSHTKIEPMKSQSRRSNEPMNKRKSQEKVSSAKSRVMMMNNQGTIYGTNNWGQWSGKVIEGLVSQSKSRIYGLINSVYSRQSLNE